MIELDWSPFLGAKPEHLSEDYIASFALRTGWIDDVGAIHPSTTLMLRYALDWWPEHSLLLAADPAWSSVTGAWVLKEGERLVRLIGKSPPIHNLNAKFSPDLTRKNAIAYLSFFCNFIHGSAGPFSLFSSLEDKVLPLNYEREKLSKFIRPPEILKEEPTLEDEGKIAFHIESLVYYGEDVFLANFIVRPNGMCEMVEDESIASELGAKIELPLVFSNVESVIEKSDHHDSNMTN